MEKSAELYVRIESNYSSLNGQLSYINSKIKMFNIFNNRKNKKSYYLIDLDYLLPKLNIMINWIYLIIITSQ